MIARTGKSVVVSSLVAASLLLASCDSSGPTRGQTDLVNTIGMEFVRIPGGTFRMGDIQGDGYRNERPVHEVTISRAFYMGRYEVTQAQWETVMTDKPSSFSSCGACPVEQVSWNDAQVFLHRLNEMEGTNAYRLPTSAEWEYAARAGTESRWSFGSDEGALGAHAWYMDNSEGRTHPVGQKNPNPWGLFDVHGNVWEWVEDRYDFDRDYYAESPWVDPQGPDSGSDRVHRGGGWEYGSEGTRSSSFYTYRPDTRYFFIGFRVLKMAQ